MYQLSALLAVAVVCASLILPTDDGATSSSKSDGRVGAAPADEQTKSVQTGGDNIAFSNKPSGQVGVLVDGQKLVPWNDVGRKTVTSKLYLGQVHSGANNEVFAFARDRLPAHLPTPWTNGIDAFSITLAGSFKIPITVWIVKGPYAGQVMHAQNAIIKTRQIWKSERVGLALGPITWIDATGDPDAATVEDFPNGDQGDSVGWKPLRDLIGFEPKRLNIYWLDTVNGHTTWGWSNFGAQIVMGRNTGDELLSHEIGHALSLTHVNYMASFDTTNVMHSASSDRAYMTEGQIVRSHLEPSSVLRSLYIYPVVGVPLRGCPINVTSNICPAIDRRLWADGLIPANN